MVGMPTNQKTLLVTDARLAGELGGGELGGGVWLACGYGAGTLTLRLPPSGYRGFAWFETSILSRQRCQFIFKNRVLQVLHKVGGQFAECRDIVATLSKLSRQSVQLAVVVLVLLKL